MRSTLLVLLFAMPCSAGSLQKMKNATYELQAVIRDVDHTLDPVMRMASNESAEWYRITRKDLGGLIEKLCPKLRKGAVTYGDVRRLWRASYKYRLACEAVARESNLGVAHIGETTFDPIAQVKNAEDELWQLIHGR